MDNEKKGLFYTDLNLALGAIERAKRSATEGTFPQSADEIKRAEKLLRNARELLEWFA